MVEKKRRITIQDLYPDLSPEEQAEAEANIKAYIRVVWKIFQRLEREGRLDEVLKEARLREEWEKGRGKKD